MNDDNAKLDDFPDPSDPHPSRPNSLRRDFPWSWTLLASLVNLLLLAWVVESIVTRRPPAVSFRMIWPIAVPFALTAVWVAVQMMPGLPQQWHHPIWASAVEILGQGVGGSISVDPFETGSGLVRLLAYGGIFWLSLQYCRYRCSRCHGGSG